MTEKGAAAVSGGRIWFKPDCVRWIREGKKTTTFRLRQHDGIYEVVEGSRYKARPVGLRVRLTPIDVRIYDDVINFHFHQEGDFKNAKEFLNWLIKVKLLEKLPTVGWLHRIEIVEAGG